MTISIFLPVGDKSEKTPFMDVQVHPTQTQPPLPKNAKFLEIRDGGLPNTNNNDYGPSKPFKMIYWMHRPIDYVKLIKKLSMFIAFILIFLGTLVILYIYDKSEIDSFKKMNCEQQQDTKDDDSPQKDIDLTKMTLLPVPDSNQSHYPTEYRSYLPKINLVSISRPIEFNFGKMQTMQPYMDIKQTAYYLHDYKVDITAIIDSENQRCYVLPLIEPPEYLFGKPITTSIKTWKMVEELKMYFIVIPAIKDLSDYGSRISKLCANYQTFKMEKHSEFVDSEIVG